MSSQACNVHIEGSRSAIVALKSPDELKKDSRGHLRELPCGLDLGFLKCWDLVQICKLQFQRWGIICKNVRFWSK